jgi:cytoskeletal protein RodZ
MDVGRELAEARQRLQLSREEVASATKIQAAKIEALERNDYQHLPSGIYLDGIIRVYAQEVGLDPEPLVEQARVESAAFAAGPDQLPAERDLAPLKAEPDLPLKAEPDLNIAAAPHGRRSAEAAQPYPEPSQPYLVPPAALAGPQPSHAMRWALPVVALLAAIGWGLYFYSVRDPFPQNTPAAAVTDRGVPDEERARATRTADATDATTPTESRERAAENTGRTRLPADRVTADRAAGRSAADTAREAARGPVAPSAAGTGNNAARPTAASARERDAENAAGVKVAGSWDLATNVESATYKAYHGMRLGYRVRLEQQGNRITGTGHKWTENGRELAPKARTPIKLEGTAEGQRLTLNFTEQGARRPSNGKFILHVTDDGLLRGRFSSTAARSSGTAEARPLP